MITIHDDLYRQFYLAVRATPVQPGEDSRRNPSRRLGKIPQIFANRVRQILPKPHCHFSGVKRILLRRIARAFADPSAGRRFDENRSVADWESPEERMTQGLMPLGRNVSASEADTSG